MTFFRRNNVHFYKIVRKNKIRSKKKKKEKSYSKHGFSVLTDYMSRYDFIAWPLIFKMKRIYKGIEDHNTVLKLFLCFLYTLYLSLILDFTRLGLNCSYTRLAFSTHHFSVGFSDFFAKIREQFSCLHFFSSYAIRYANDTILLLHCSNQRQKKEIFPW